jgi:phosphomannomutase
MSPTDDEILGSARSYLAEDPDADTRAELRALLDPPDLPELRDRFGRRLEFGTAGLRGALGAGPNRMNRVVVQRTAAGLARYLLDTGHAGGSVVIGYDARHRSDVFALDTARIIAGAGLRPLLFDGHVPTPVVAFAIRSLGAVAGVVVTASHNPPADNGYKVYLGDGSQIVTPADADISAAIDTVGALADIPRGAVDDRIGAEVIDRYVDRVRALLAEIGTATRGDRAALRVVYTPLHGVGGPLLRRCLVDAGFAEPMVVPEQADPDPDFPTVPFPNPEEEGAIDAALALARSVHADLVIANDPDADRCAFAVPDVGGWRMLTGDEVGVLLGRRLLAARPDGVFASSIVSSGMLGALAARQRARYVETLTGFKWIGRVPDLAFGYEEALGYCTDPVAVRDKDGISAALVFADLAATSKAAGRSVVDDLDDAAREVGAHATRQVSARFDDSARLPAVMAHLRREPPGALGRWQVLRVDDLAAGSADLPPTDGLRFVLEGGHRVTIRPSGTEPKVKAYLEVVLPVTGGDAVGCRRTAAEHLSELETAVGSLLG